MTTPAPKLPYAPEDSVFPSPSDDDLWQTVFQTLKADYPERVLVEHARWAFEAVCAEHADSMPAKDFIRKVRLKWLWKRPPAPRGVLDLE